MLEAVVIGAGVIGLAVARALARAGCEPVVIEAERAIGMHQSSRNSEVIHAGIYDPPGSLRARTCVEGRRRLYAYCSARGIGHRRCGKLIVATTPDERQALSALVANAAACGTDDLRALSTAELAALEPELRCEAAVLSPSTGIIDSHGLLRALQSDAEEAGASLALATPVEGITVADDGSYLVRTADDEVPTRRVINAAGLGAQALARTLADAASPTWSIPALHIAKGSYFTIAGRPFSRLVYPVPEPSSLGIHVTIDLAGEVRFGPDRQWVDAIDYGVDPARAAAFEPAIRRYWPALPPGALQPAYAGIRAKLQAPGQPPVDFLVHGPDAHGLPGVVHLFGIESPGLTASLALADRVVETLALQPV